MHTVDPSVDHSNRFEWLTLWDLDRSELDKLFLNLALKHPTVFHYETHDFLKRQKPLSALKDCGLASNNCDLPRFAKIELRG